MTYARDQLTRREFVVAGAGVAGSALAVAYGGATGKGPHGAFSTGAVHGVMLDLQGVAQANFGQAILMLPGGRHTGVRATPDAAGRFRFDNLQAGDYQIRFHASGQAIVPEPY